MRDNLTYSEKIQAFKTLSNLKLNNSGGNSARIIVFPDDRVIKIDLKSICIHNHDSKKLFDSLSLISLNKSIEKSRNNSQGLNTFRTLQQPSHQSRIAFSPHATSNDRSRFHKTQFLKTSIESQQLQAIDRQSIDHKSIDQLSFRSLKYANQIQTKSVKIQSNSVQFRSTQCETNFFKKEFEIIDKQPTLKERKKKVLKSLRTYRKTLQHQRTFNQKPQLDYLKYNKRQVRNVSFQILDTITETFRSQIIGKMTTYEKIFKLERNEFIKIYAYYISLCFLTIFKTQPLKNWNLQCNGIDMGTLKKQGFPQLIFENDVVVERLFNSIKRDLDYKTNCLNFDSFIGIVCSFRTKSIEDKIERFFKLIDEDGNGMLSYSEIYNLCTRSFKNYEDDGQPDDFFRNLSEYFAQFIFKCVDMDPTKEISMDEMKRVIKMNQDGADLLEMFCGEDNVKLCI